jgi:phenylacetate-coenzyme A ligase PaaK-like adenylate-forming protein
MSEGIFAGFCGHGSHLPDDLCVFEPVGADGRPVVPGVPSERVYVTNLYNHALPMIRFEVTDEVTVLGGPCPCGSAFRRIADPQGRLDDIFVYPGGTSVHPHVFRSSLGQHRQIVEYQVRQTDRGADVRVVADADIDGAVVEAKIAEALAACGLDQPEVTFTRVTTLDRQPSGKLKRFIRYPAD